MFKVQMNDKPNLALIKNEAQICKNSPLRLVTIMAKLIMEFQVRGAKLKVYKSRKEYGVLDSSKKRTKLTILSTEGAQDSEFRSFFGRIQDAIICLRDLVSSLY
jgi:hypothetical protein